jgi:hypothetical protein
VIAGGIGSCQISVLLRHQRAEVADLRAHVAVGQLEPGAGEGVGELVRILAEALARSSRRPGRPQRQSSVVSIVGTRFFDWIVRVRDVGLRLRPSAATAARRPGSWSAPIRKSNRFSKK